MSLLSPPTETLEQVIRYHIPEAYEEASLTCKKLHEASLFHRTQYNAFRQRFRHFSYDPDADPRDINESDQRHRPKKVPAIPPFVMPSTWFKSLLEPPPSADSFRRQISPETYSNHIYPPTCRLLLKRATLPCSGPSSFLRTSGQGAEIRTNGSAPIKSTLDI